MNVVRNETRTGLLVLLSLAALIGVLIYLGAPGVFTAQKEFGIYFDNAAGIKLGTPVMLAGRKVGQVTAIDSPVPNAERPLGKDGKPLELEARVMVRVDKRARIFDEVKVQLASYSFLSEPVIDFTDGVETSGLAAENKRFVGERPGGLADTGIQIVEKIDPAITQLVSALKSLENTANNLTKLTSEGSDLPVAFAEIRKVSANLAEITGPGGSLRKSLDGLEELAGNNGEIAKALTDFRKLIAPDGNLSQAIANVEKFTAQLSNSNDVPVILKNFRAASERLTATIAELRGDLSTVSGNLEQATDTVKRQPWRLIWPSTKKYPEEAPPKPKPTPVPKRKK
jgi:ABC-type transporter Mla subunit MlaD